MGKTCNLTPRKSAETKGLLSTKNYSNWEVSRRLFVSKSSVRRIEKKIELGQELILQRKKMWGRKPIFTPRLERCFKKICLEDQFATTKDIKSMLESSDIHASERTLRRRMAFTVQCLQTHWEAKIDCCYESEMSWLGQEPQWQKFGLM